MVPGMEQARMGLSAFCRYLDCTQAGLMRILRYCERNVSLLPVSTGLMLRTPYASLYVIANPERFSQCDSIILL